MSGPASSIATQHNPQTVFKDFIKWLPEDHYVHHKDAADFGIAHPLSCRMKFGEDLTQCEVHRWIEDGHMEHYPQGDYRIISHQNEFRIEKKDRT